MPELTPDFNKAQKIAYSNTVSFPVRGGLKPIVNSSIQMNITIKYKGFSKPIQKSNSYSLRISFLCVRLSS